MGAGLPLRADDDRSALFCPPLLGTLTYSRVGSCFGWRDGRVCSDR